MPASALRSTHPETPGSLLVFGAGKMGGAMLKGALAAGWQASSLKIIDPSPSEDITALATKTGIALNPAAPKPVNMVLLAIKPQMLAEAATTLAPWLDAHTVVVSILAGKTIAALRAHLPQTEKIVRAMPNTPAAIGRGVTGAYPSPALTAEERARVQALLETTGTLLWLADEPLIDAVTAISGSGPAYVFHLVEALAAAGEALGLPAPLAMVLARTTLEGAGELLHQQPELSAATLRQNVTSPGGTTQAALTVLMDEASGLPPLMQRATLAARNRAQALNG